MRLFRVRIGSEILLFRGNIGSQLLLFCLAKDITRSSQQNIITVALMGCRTCLAGIQLAGVPCQRPRQGIQLVDVQMIIFTFGPKSN